MTSGEKLPPSETSGIIEAVTPTEDGMTTELDRITRRAKLVAVDTLEQHPDNPRTITPARLEQLKATLAADPGMLEARPLIALPDGRVIGGNQRLAAARALGWKKIPTVVVDLDADTAKLWMLRDNNGYGEWDDGAVAAMLEGLGGDLDLALTGFDDAELQRLLAPVPVERGEAPEPGAVPEVPRSQRGEVYELGPHRLMCGDATQAADVATLTGGGSVDLLLTDPPYCSGGFQESGKSAGSVGTTGVHKQIANDRLSTRGYIALLKAAIGAAPADYAYVFTDWRMWVYLFDVVESSGFGVRSMIVWDKSSPGMGRGWRSQHELIMWGAKVTPPFDKHAPGAGNVIQVARTGNPLHTTQKPVELLEQLLAAVPFAEAVYDPFAGSGSVLMAAETQGRRCFAMELDPGYCDVIRDRWAAWDA